MSVQQQKSLVLILTRELASNVATPMFVLDRHGNLVFYNEPAESLTGQPFSQVGEIHARDWGSRFMPQSLDGTPLELDSLPPAVALLEQRPAHQLLRIVGGDGQRRTIAITAFPLFARADEFVGAVAIFWEDRAQAR